MVFGPSGRDHDSQNQLFLLCETPRYFKKSNKSQIISKNISFGNSTILEIETFEFVGKDGDRQSKIRLFYENIEHGMNIYPKT